MQKYSIFSLIKNAFTNHENWDVAWKDPEPKKEYDAVIVGGGGHGLATAYYLAKEHKITNVAILEKGWIGGGNVGRNTTILRSNYMWDANGLFYEVGLKALQPCAALSATTCVYKLNFSYVRTTFNICTKQAQKE